MSTRDNRVWRDDLLPTLAGLPGGRQVFWGIPFQLVHPESAKPNVLVVDRRTTTQSASVPVAGTATYVVFAHFSGDGLAGADQSQDIAGSGNEPGSRVGYYSLVYEGGSEARVALRRQFEICPPFGQQPYVGRLHAEPTPVDPRGPYPRGGWGWMQLGTVVGDLLAPWEDIAERLACPPGAWTLYALKNPKPTTRISQIRVDSEGDGVVVVGAVTLFSGGSHPLRRERLSTVALAPASGGSDTLRQTEVSVDLGVVARTIATSAVDIDSWLREPAGTGEPPTRPDRLCVQVTASPDATLWVGGSPIPIRQLYDQAGGRSHDGRWHARVVDRDRQWLHATVVDAATGQPTPARVHFRSLDGQYLPPYGHRAEVNPGWFEDYGADLRLGSTQYAYVTGDFRIQLPAGPVLAEVSKGFEYAPIRTRIDIEPGQTELALRLDRMTDRRRDGWVTGDTHVHFLSPDTARLEAKAEDVHVVNLLAAQWGDLYTNVGDITGDLSGCSDAETLVWVGTENRQHMLGHISLLGVQGGPVTPFSTAGPREGYLGEGTAKALAEWADEARGKGGLVVAPHFSFDAAEIIADIVLGKVDAIELAYWLTDTLDNQRVREWYQLLNSGYRVPLVGGTDKMSACVPVGGTRTYAHIGDRPLDFASWAGAVREGRTYMTSGPLLTFEVEGHIPGAQLHLPAGGGTVHVTATVVSAQPVRTFEIVQNGRVIMDTSVPDDGATTLSIAGQVAVDTSSWVAARCSTGRTAWHDIPTLVAAHTSPVYITCGGSPMTIGPDTARSFRTRAQGALEWLETLATVDSPAAHQRIRQVLLDAIGELEAGMRSA